METIKKNFNVVNFVLNSENINKFEIMENRRQIGESHVKKIHGNIIKGNNPLGVIIVNEKNGYWRLIDGNHRIEAVKRFYSKDSNKKYTIECTIRLYKNLTSEEERIVYSNEAKRKNESHEDRLNLYKDTIAFWKLTQDKLNEFPCRVTIYPMKNSLRFRTILDCLSTVKGEQKNGYVPTYYGKDEIIGFAQELGYDDFIKIKNFIVLFQEVFGMVGKDNTFCRRQGFLPLFDIYDRNVSLIGYDKLKKRMSNILGKSDILFHLNVQGREAQQRMREIMLEHINHGTRNKAI